MPNADATACPVTYGGLGNRLERHGLALRGGLHPGPGDSVPPGPAGKRPGTLVLVGVVGGRIWTHFEGCRGEGRDPLDAWTRDIVDEVAARAGAVPVYPNDKPFWPFQQWARRAEAVFPSPLGLLIHPVYGLWHAYRAAILLPGRIDLPDVQPARSPCDACRDKPCLSRCPVGAFSPAGYDVPKCAGHLAGAAGEPCLSGGCRARDACPVGAAYRYPDPQIRFHMAAFNRSVNPG